MKAASPATLVRLTRALGVPMETGIVAVLAYPGYHTGTSTGTKIILAVVAPLLGFGFWGAVDFHQAGRLTEPLRRIRELAISGLAAVALYAAGQHILGWALAGCRSATTPGHTAGREAADIRLNAQARWVQVLSHGTVAGAAPA